MEPRSSEMETHTVYDVAKVRDGFLLWRSIVPLWVSCALPEKIALRLSSSFVTPDRTLGQDFEHRACFDTKRFTTSPVRDGCRHLAPGWCTAVREHWSKDDFSANRWLGPSRAETRNRTDSLKARKPRRVMEPGARAWQYCTNIYVIVRRLKEWLVFHGVDSLRLIIVKQRFEDINVTSQAGKRRGFGIFTINVHISQIFIHRNVVWRRVCTQEYPWNIDIANLPKSPHIN